MSRSAPVAIGFHERTGSDGCCNCELSPPSQRPATCGARWEPVATAIATERRTSIPALASVPLDTNDAGAFLQGRLLLLTRVWLVLVLAFFVIGKLGQVGERMLPVHLGHWLGYTQLAIAGFLAAVWLRLRGPQRSERELRLIDVTCLLVPISMVGCLLWFSPTYLRGELLMLLVFAHVHMTRAVIVPSSARATLSLGVLTAVPLLVGTYAHYIRAANAALPAPLFYTTVVFTWSSASLMLSTLTSRTLYGLRRRLIDATQLGQYTLEHKIGQGGMGIVYRARHAMLRRPTAIKLLPPERAGEQNIARFEREVQLTSLLTHPNTIAVYDYGRTPDGIFYYAMEYLDGLDLEELVSQDGPQAPGCVACICEQVSGALAEAHAAGLIHRDIKPANIFLCERGGTPGVAKVVDFGLVKSLTPDTSNPNVSSVNTITGTPLYLSPEAVSQPASVDARSDVYALGAVAYFLLTGRNVFEASTIVGVCGQHLHSIPVPPSERLGQPLPADLEALVLGCLEKDPGRRPQTATELAASMRALPCFGDFTKELRTVWWKRVTGARRAKPKPETNSSVSRTLAIDWQARG